ncbi:flavin-containing monooxygenase FMO GS-OX-like 8 [Setaria italica]|nr:flavin-containing monooxygenase FMO GS-OX-like 8 [Setaria italica]
MPGSIVMDMASMRPPAEPKKVCVVGAGMSGLAAARELRREGLAVTVLEQCGDIGGQWLYDPRTDADDPLGAAVPVNVHGSMYASVRLISTRETMGFSDFQFVPRPGAAGRDARRFPGRREVYCYLKDFCAAFGLADAVRLNTRVVRVAMAAPAPREASGGDVKWLVRSVHVQPDGSEDGVAAEEVFDAVVVANGHYSQPRLPKIQGMGEWSRRQLHSHSYRVPDPYRDETVVIVGCGDSGLDIALDLSGVAKEVHLSARTVGDATTPAVSNILANHSDMHLHPQVHRLCEDGRVVFADGSSVVADTVIYCTGYLYSFPFLDTGGVVTVDDNRVGPLFEHTFPPALAPSLSFVGIPMRVFVPWFLEAQARWIARVLSGTAALPPEQDMLQAVQEDYRAREMAGLPARYSHDIGMFKISEILEFVNRYTDLPNMEDWKMELLLTTLGNMKDNRETFQDRDDYSENVNQGFQRWLSLAGAQYEAAIAAGGAGDDDAGGDAAEVQQKPLPLHLKSEL